jgi:hypothetical protein
MPPAERTPAINQGAQNVEEEKKTKTLTGLTGSHCIRGWHVQNLKQCSGLLILIAFSNNS